MALTRPKLKEILSKAGADNEKITEAVEEIIAGHTTSIEALKEERNSYKEKAERFDETDQKLKELEARNAENPIEQQYNDLKQEFDNYKNTVEAEKLKSKKITATKSLLTEIKIPEKYHDKIISVTKFDEMELDDNGKIKNYDKFKTEMTNDWGVFAVSTSKVGANVDTPPNENPIDYDGMTDAEYYKATYERKD